MTNAEVSLLREQLHIHPTIINLNVGSCSISPRPLLREANNLRAQIASDPVGLIWEKILVKIEESRQALADYFRIPSSGLLLMENASFAINTLIQGLPWQGGEEVIMTDQEYEHYLPLWRRVANQYGLTLKTVTLPKATHMSDANVEDIVTAFEVAISDRTTHLFFSHVAAPTGLQLPVKEIVEWGRVRNIVTIVDGAHAPGLLPVDLSEIKPDFYFGNIHKWLMGIPSAGFLYVGDQRRIEPLLTSMFYIYEPDKTELATFPGGPSHFAANLEYHGTQDRVAQALISDTLGFRSQFGEQWFFERMSELSSYSHQMIVRQGFEMVSYNNPNLKTAMVTFKVPPVCAIKTWQWFRKHGFEVAVKSAGHDKYIRISNPAFLLEEELDSFASILSKIPWRDLR